MTNVVLDGQIKIHLSTLISPLYKDLVKRPLLFYFAASLGDANLAESLLLQAMMKPISAHHSFDTAARTPMVYSFARKPAPSPTAMLGFIGGLHNLESGPTLQPTVCRY